MARLARTVVVLLLLTLTEPAGAVVGGSVEPAPWTGRVSSKAGCTATLLDQWRVLTAAHCVADGPVSITMGAASYKDLDPATAQLAEADKVYVHPDWNAERPRTPVDLAVVWVTEPFDLSTGAVKPVAISDQPAGSGTEASLWGFGQQSAAGDTDGRQRRLRMTVADACPHDDWEPRLCARSDEGAVCAGDSGSGLVRASDGALLGVLSIRSTSCRPGDEAGFSDVTDPAAREFLVSAGSAPAEPRGGRDSVLEVVDGQLRCRPGTWVNAPTAFSYAFVEVDSGATLSLGPDSYTLTSADNGRNISCLISAANAAGQHRRRVARVVVNGAAQGWATSVRITYEHTAEDPDLDLVYEDTVFEVAGRSADLVVRLVVASLGGAPVLDVRRRVDDFPLTRKLEPGRYRACLFSDPTPEWRLGSTCRTIAVNGRAGELVSLKQGVKLKLRVKKPAQGVRATLEWRQGSRLARRVRRELRDGMTITPPHRGRWRLTVVLPHLRHGGVTYRPERKVLTVR